MGRGKGKGKWREAVGEFIDKSAEEDLCYEGREGQTRRSYKGARVEEEKVEWACHKDEGRRGDQSSHTSNLPKISTKTQSPPKIRTPSIIFWRKFTSEEMEAMVFNLILVTSRNTSPHLGRMLEIHLTLQF